MNFWRLKFLKLFSAAAVGILLFSGCKIRFHDGLSDSSTPIVIANSGPIAVTSSTAVFSMSPKTGTSAVAHAVSDNADNTHMVYGRYYHTATLLTSGTHAGKVLVVGGGDTGIEKAELWDPTANSGTGSFTDAGNLIASRTFHTATLLISGVHAGKVLVAGGADSVGINGTAELWDPDGNGGAGSFSAAGNLIVPRQGHRATLLTSGTHAGKVLITGGMEAGGASYTAELWDPVTSTSTLTGTMGVERNIHSATLLTSGTHAGKVLVVGGVDSGGTENASAELWDPAGNAGAGTFTPTGSLTTGRQYHTATLVLTGSFAGQVVVAGGSDAGLVPVAGVEIWDPDGNAGAGAFSPTGAMVNPRLAHTATYLTSGPDKGKILCAGGMDGTGATIKSAELWDPTGNLGAGTFATTGSMETPRYLHTATLLSSGTEVVMIGGANDSGYLANTAELWNSTSESFSAATPSTDARYNHTSTLLSSGKVLLVGGIGASATVYVSASASVWDPSLNGGTGSYTTSGSLANARAYGHTATLLTSGIHAGKVLVVGGTNLVGTTTATAELWDPTTQTFSATGSMPAARAGHEAVFLTSGIHAGKVLVIGGYNGGGYLNTAGLWDPNGNAGVGSFSATGNLIAARSYFGAALLTTGIHSGKVLVVGGYAGGAGLATVELWDPAGNVGAGSFSATGNLITGRYVLTATPLTAGTHAGKVLVANGQQFNFSPAPLDSVELWDPNGNAGAGSFSATGSFPTPLYYTPAVALSGTQAGKVLFAGGQIGGGIHTSALHVWDPDGNAGAGSFSVLIDTLPNPRYAVSASLLADGRVFIFGGAGAGSVPENGYSLYSPFSTVSLSATGGTSPYSASLLSGTGTVYFTGSSGLYVPNAGGSSTIRIQDSLGAYGDSEITVTP